MDLCTTNQQEVLSHEVCVDLVADTVLRLQYALANTTEQAERLATMETMAPSICEHLPHRDWVD